MVISSSYQLHTRPESYPESTHSVKPGKCQYPASAAKVGLVDLCRAQRRHILEQPHPCLRSKEVGVQRVNKSIWQDLKPEQSEYYTKRNWNDAYEKAVRNTQKIVGVWECQARP